MAPEQARGSRELLPAVDIFSLGCVLYECLAGEPPFVADHVAAMLLRILFEEPVPLIQRRQGIPDAVSELLEQMLKKDAGQRPADAMALCARLADIRVRAALSSYPTLAAAAKPPSMFAEDEQALFSLVMAAEPESIAPSIAATPPSLPNRAASRHASVVAAVAVLRVRAEVMADGVLVATVSRTGSVTDQVALAARVALLIKEHWPEAVVTVATVGYGDFYPVTAYGRIIGALMMAGSVALATSTLAITSCLPGTQFT